MELEKDVIQYELADDGICTIWLNRPHKRNCVSPQLLRELEVAVDRAAADKKALAVVFRGRGNTSARAPISISWSARCCMNRQCRSSSRSIPRAPMTRSTI